VDKSRLAFRLLGSGLYMGVCIFLGVAGGVWLDRKFDTQPVFILIGLTLGLILAFWGFYRMLVPILKDTSDIKRKRERRG
jgi:ATP synthase protein I